MKKILHPAHTRGAGNFGSLAARYSFGFANFYNPERIQFGTFRVINDTIVAGERGFGKHQHQNMIIVTIP